MRTLLRSAAIASLVAVVWVFAHASTAAQGRRVLQLRGASAAQARQWDARIESMVRNGELHLDTITSDELLPGRAHERFSQRYHGLPVLGGAVTREIDTATVGVLGDLYTNIDVDTNASVDLDRARAIAARSAGAPLSADRETRLVVLPEDDGTYALAYEIHGGAAARFRVFFVDAHTGALVMEMTDLHTQAAVGQGTGVLGDAKKMSASVLNGGYVADDKMRPPQLVTYDLKGNLVRTEQVLDSIVRPTDGDKAADADNVWTDGAVVDAHTYLGWTYDFYYKRFNRHGLDDNSAPMLGIVHPVRRDAMFAASPDDFGTYYTNAFWCGGCGPSHVGMMMFGEGIMPGYVTTPGNRWVDYLAGSLDIVAHELTHGVTDYSSNLLYRLESGALNEAFSDIMGTSAEFFRQPRATDVVANGATMTADYLMGEDSFRARGGGLSGLRSLANPPAFGNPDHYSKRSLGPADEDHDWGYVHKNSTIASHAFYLAIEGGTNRTSGLSVQGVGAKNREQIEKAFYRGFVYKLTANATFSMARDATIQAARDLYGAGSAAEQAITQAWNAVGVFESNVLPGARPTIRTRIDR